jgi:hypothetical protein
MAESKASLTVVPKSAPLSEPAPFLRDGPRTVERLRHRPAAAGRFSRAAEAAFRKVSAMDPGYADGP